MLHKGADHTTIAMHDQPARKPLSSSVNRVTRTDQPLELFRLQLLAGGLPLQLSDHLLHAAHFSIRRLGILARAGAL